MFPNSSRIVLAVLATAGLSFLPCQTGFAERSEKVNTGSSESLRLIAERRFAVHAEGRQWFGMANNGEYSNPDALPMWIPKLEYPGGTGTIFLFSGGL